MSFDFIIILTTDNIFAIMKTTLLMKEERGLIFYAEPAVRAVSLKEARPVKKCNKGRKNSLPQTKLCQRFY